MIEPVVQKNETLDYATWLRRSGLTPDDVFSMPSSQMAELGRQWQRYQDKVRAASRTSGTAPEQFYFAGDVPDRVPKL